MGDKTRPRIGIIGAGPGGLTLAKYLSEREETSNFTIFEKIDRPGGKCLSRQIGSHIFEFGTCYAIDQHKDVLNWMKELGIGKTQITDQEVDDVPLISFVKSARGPSLAVQTLKYLRLRSQLLKCQFSAPEKLAVPARTWLRDNKLEKIERLAMRVMTQMGYGYLEDVPVLHLFRWIDWTMFTTGLFNHTYMPDSGWEEFWSQLSAPFDIRYRSEIKDVSRREDGVVLSWDTQQNAKFDVIVNTLPLRQFGQVTKLSRAEKDIGDAIRWNGYRMSLVASESWFTKPYIRTWTKATETRQQAGGVFVARYETFESDLGGYLYGVGQNTGQYSDDELTEILVEEVAAYGATNPTVIDGKSWTYFPEYSGAAIEDGLLTTMHNVQGKNRTYHSGATFSHEAVSSICRFNKTLAKQIADRF